MGTTSSSSHNSTTPLFATGKARTHLPVWYIPVFFAVLVASLALRRGPSRIYTTLPLMLGLLSMLPYHTEGSFKKDFDLGNLVLGWFLVYLSYMFSNPEQDIWKLDDGQKISSAARYDGMQRKSFWQKLPWSLGIWTNPRGVGWSHEVPNLRPASKDRSKWGFVLRKILETVVMLLLLDMLHLWYKRLPVSSGDPSWTVWSVPVAQQILLGLSNFLRIFLEMTSMHSLAAATTVAIGISRPCDWPPMFGRLSDAYSLKRFWGMVWHQLLRQVAHPTGLLVSRDLLRLSKNTVLARSAYLFGAFAATGLYHSIVSIHATGFVRWNPVGDMAFFLLQAATVLVEGFAIDLVVKSGHGGKKGVWKGLGYIWTACVLGYTHLWWLEELRQAGMWQADLRIFKYFPIHTS